MCPARPTSVGAPPPGLAARLPVLSVMSTSSPEVRGRVGPRARFDARSSWPLSSCRVTVFSRVIRLFRI